MTKKTKKYTIIIVIFAIVGLIYHKFSPYKLQFLGHYNKVWAHRVNSLEKLKTATDFYDGVEFDLVYDDTKNTFDINHPPAKSIDLNFETYLSALGKNRPYLWLDIKNLKQNNTHQIFEKLEELFNTIKYPKHKLLIESRYPEALSIFIANNYKTSYYVNYKLKHMIGKEKTSELKKIDSILNSQPKLALSSNYLDYKTLTENFPQKDKYFWMLRSDINLHFFKNRKMLKDTTVIAVLATYNAIKGNR